MRDSDNSLMVSADIHPEHTGRGYRSASILNSQPHDCCIKLVVSFALVSELFGAELLAQCLAHSKQ